MDEDGTGHPAVSVNSLEKIVGVGVRLLEGERERRVGREQTNGDSQLRERLL